LKINKFENVSALMGNRELEYIEWVGMGS
jgi:hypothetical protein